MILTMKGISRKGKNRVREAGSEWRVTRGPRKVGLDHHKGLWVLVEPIGGDREWRQAKSRWVRTSPPDRDFSLCNFLSQGATEPVEGKCKSVNGM